MIGSRDDIGNFLDFLAEVFICFICDLCPLIVGRFSLLHLLDQL